MLSVAHLNLGDIGKAIAAGHRMVDLGLPSMWLAVATAASGNHQFAVEQYWQTRLLMNTVIFPPAGTKTLSGSALDTYWRIAARGVCSGRAVHRTVYCTASGWRPADASECSLTSCGAQSRIYAHTFGIEPMAQLHCYLPEGDAELLRRRATRAGMSVSRYLAELARKDLISEWPEDYFGQLFGRDEIAPIKRGPQDDFETRAPLE